MPSQEHLEDHSHRSKHLRPPTASSHLVEAVLRLRQEYPRWGKDKLMVLRREQGYPVSTSYGGKDNTPSQGRWGAQAN